MQKLVYRPLWALLGIVMSMAISVIAHAHRVHSLDELRTHLQPLQQSNQPTAQNNIATKPFFRTLFEPMDVIMPTPNTYRTADGAPGSDYWENRADYDIAVALDEATNRITGTVTITYHNNSPQTLRYLWLQLDQQGLQHDTSFHNGNIVQNQQPDRRNDPRTGQAAMNLDSLKLLLNKQPFGFTIKSVTNADGQPLAHFIQGTQMRLDLASPLVPSSVTSVRIEYDYVITDANYNLDLPARTGFETYPDGSKAFYIMQFYPRLAYFDQSNGWDVRQYLGKGEFNLHFGDFDVRITVPKNHVVSASGELQNPQEVLSDTQHARWQQAKNTTKAVQIVSKKEAVVNRKTTTKAKHTWHFSARNVRDVAFASSSRFIWEAAQGNVGVTTKKPVLLQSFYHPENDAFPSRLSLPVAQHTLDVYSQFTFDYPYPVLNVVEGAKMSMEYPMLATYNFTQNTDGTHAINAEISALVTLTHEVGHNFTPMVVSNNERKWAWMDEGLNTFLHTQALVAWSDLGELVAFHGIEGGQAVMAIANRSPLMNLPDNTSNLSEYATIGYTIPALALTTLRETVLGRAVFDKAFKEYFTIWQFKHPEPYDFFRHMEKASGRNLQWFWRGWFYSSGHVDMAIDSVRIFQLQTLTEQDHKSGMTAAFTNPRSNFNQYITRLRDKKIPKFIDKNPALAGFYDKVVTGKISLSPLEKAQLKAKRAQLGKENLHYLKTNKRFVQVTVSNRGGIIMPVIVQVDFVDGSSMRKAYSANIWREKQSTTTDVVMVVPNKTIATITLDPNLQTGDVRRINNYWSKSHFDTQEYIYLEKFAQPTKPNLMQLLQQSEANAQSGGT